MRPASATKVLGETLRFDCPSGDQNSGGLLHPTDQAAPTAPDHDHGVKNEFGCNVYRESRLDSVIFSSSVYKSYRASTRLCSTRWNRGSISIRAA